MNISNFYKFLHQIYIFLFYLFDKEYKGNFNGINFTYFLTMGNLKK